MTLALFLIVILCLLVSPLFAQPAVNRDDVLARMRQVMGDPPPPEKRVPVDVNVVGESHDEHVRRWKITFSVEPGDRCPAWLIAPRSDAPAPRPGALCLHQTTRIGKDEPAGLGGKPDLAYAHELARRGWVAIVPDYPGFGENRTDPYSLGYASGTMKGIWNHIRAVDVLLALSDSPRKGDERPGDARLASVRVAADRLVTLGHSLGGHNALFVAAFDSRLRAAVSSCGFTRFTHNDDEGRGKPGDLSDWTGKPYMPRIRERYESSAAKIPFDFTDILTVIAPRGLFINAPLRDVMRVAGVYECLDHVRPIYAATGKPSLLASAHPDCEHEFPKPVREQAYAYLESVVGRP